MVILIEVEYKAKFLSSNYILREKKKINTNSRDFTCALKTFAQNKQTKAFFIFTEVSVRRFFVLFQTSREKMGREGKLKREYVE